MDRIFFKIWTEKKNVYRKIGNGKAFARRKGTLIFRVNMACSNILNVRSLLIQLLVPCVVQDNSTETATLNLLGQEESSNISVFVNDY